MTPKQSPFARIQIINQRHPASWSRSNIPENKKIFFLTSGNLILIPPLQLPQSPRRFQKKMSRTVDHKPFQKPMVISLQDRFKSKQPRVASSQPPTILRASIQMVAYSKLNLSLMSAMSNSSTKMGSPLMKLQPVVGLNFQAKS